MFAEQTHGDETTQSVGDVDLHPYNGASAPPTEKSIKDQQSVGKPINDYRQTVEKPNEELQPVEETLSRDTPAKEVREHQPVITKPVHKATDCACSLVCRWRGAVIDCAAMQTYRRIASPIVLWKNPWVSGTVFLSSLALVISLKYWSALTALSFWLLSVMALSAIYKLTSTIVVSVLGYSIPDLPSFLTNRWRLPEPAPEKLVENLVTKTNNFLDELQRILLWEKVIHSLMAVGFLFLAFNVGRCFDTLTLLLIKIVVMFTIPVFLTHNQVHIERFYKIVKDNLCQAKNSIVRKLPRLGKGEKKE